MQLIDLVRKLVDNPEEREAFQKSPEAYIATQEELLQSYLRTLNSTIKPPPLETATVMGLRTGRSIFNNINDERNEETISLKGHMVFLKPRLPFFVEYQYPLGSDATEYQYTCMLLRHSYIEVRTQGDKPVVAMRLHLCFVDPQDSQDQPQVVDIRTMIEPTHPNPLDLGNQLAYLTLSKNSYILLRGDSEFACKLGEFSEYNQTTGQLTLVFDKQA